MVEERGSVWTSGWQDLLHWLTLLGRAFRLAIAPRMLLLALLGLLGMIAGWRLLGAVFRVELPPQVDLWPTELRRAEFVDPAVYRNADLVEGTAAGVLGRFSNPFTESWRAISWPFHAMFNDGLSLLEFTFLLLCALWAAVVWALIGGAITRVAAVALARTDRLGMLNGLNYARRKWTSYFAAPLFPILGVLLGAIPLMILGLLMRLDVGLFVASILWPLALLATFVMAVVLVGLAFGWPLMWPTISVEGTDSFDAMSRSYAYLYQRPLQYFLYALVASLIGILGWLVVGLFIETTLRLLWWGVSFGSGAENVRDVKLLIATTEREGIRGIAASIITFWHSLLVMLWWAFALSFFWTAATAIYYLLRFHVDQTELDDVTVEDEELYGTAGLASEGASVPVVHSEPTPPTSPPRTDPPAV